MLDDSVLDSLVCILGEENVLSDPYNLDRYSSDALNPFRAFAAEGAFDRLTDVVVRPGSTEEVAQLVVFANEHRIPVIPFGAGTGVMGGVLPVQGGMTVDLQRLNRILEVNPQDMTAVVEPGVVLQDLVDMLKESGLMPGHDPYSVPIATVAGAISTNGVGYRASAFGSMGDQVVSVEVVLPTGHLLATKQVPKYAAGPNLNHLFIGTEGVFGIITKATIKVFRIPEAQEFATVSFESFDQGFEAAAELTALGIRPTLTDLTEEDEHVRLHLVFEGYREGVAAQLQRSMQVCTELGGRDIGTGPSMDYWLGRHQSGENYKENALGRPREVRWIRQQGSRFDYLHMALPISRVLEYRRRCQVIMAGTGVRVVEYSIWSRPELFSMMLVADPADNDEFRNTLGNVVDQILTLAQDMGGTMEYCHGIGVKLNHLAAREMGLGQDVVRLLKNALDPANVMNPGKLGL